MNQVGSDKQLGGAVGQLAHDMPIPNFLEKRLTHKG
jgi:hypothetical protein